MCQPMNNLADALRNAGCNIPAPKGKIDSSKVNLADKIEKCREYLKKANKAVNMINNAPDKETSYTLVDSAVLNYQRYVEALKDILTSICEKESVPLSEKKSLSEVIRKSLVIVNADKDIESSIKTLTDRNEVVHDYINNGYYDEVVIKHIINNYQKYSLHLDMIKQHCELKKYI